MTISKKMREQMLEMCGSLCDDDGLDARKYHEEKRTPKQSDEHRRQRLCSQVARTLRLALPESGSDLLRSLQVITVEPGKNSSNLVVKIQRPTGIDAMALELLIRELENQQATLRTAVASAITRKRTPRLKFEFAADSRNGNSDRERASNA